MASRLCGTGASSYQKSRAIKYAHVSLPVHAIHSFKPRASCLAGKDLLTWCPIPRPGSPMFRCSTAGTRRVSKQDSHPLPLRGCYDLSMSAITFDTLKFVERLEKAGVSREQAAAMAEAQKEAFSEALDISLATKSDISGLKTELVSLRGDVKSELSAVRGEVANMKWMLGVLIAIAAANFAKQFF